MAYHRIDVRLTPAEFATVTQLQAALSTPLLPRVPVTEVLRAGLRVLGERVHAAEARA